MSASRKTWGSHSARWQREARNAGLSPDRWNRWRHLPESTRKETDPRKYAGGESVRKQIFDKRHAKAVENMHIASISARPGVLEGRVDAMTPGQVKWTSEADPDAILDRMSDRGYAQRHHMAHNPWMYHGVS